jgi:hypothetical protein
MSCIADTVNRLMVVITAEVIKMYELGSLKWLPSLLAKTGLNFFAYDFRCKCQNFACA